LIKKKGKKKQVWFYRRSTSGCH